MAIEKHDNSYRKHDDCLYKFGQKKLNLNNLHD